MWVKFRFYALEKTGNPFVCLFFLPPLYFVLKVIALKINIDIM